MVGAPRRPPLTFPTHHYLRHRLILCTLASRAVRFTQIRSEDEKPGLSPSEISFLRLLDKLTSGSTIEINETGTSLYYNPGLLIGGSISHDAHTSRGIAYYLHPLLMLAPFCKHPLQITFRGATHCAADVCVDSVAAVSIPLLRRLTLGADLNPTLDVKKRAMAPGKGGVAKFTCGIAKQRIEAVDLVQAGFVKRIRGIAMAAGAAPGATGRMVDIVRGVLNDFTPDVYVHTDVVKGGECGRGYGMQLVAESTEGCLLGADWSGEDVSKAAEGGVGMLLEEIDGGGCVDSWNLGLAVTFCAVGEGVGRVRVGKVGESGVAVLRDLERIWGVAFRVREGEGGLVLSCVGVGVENVARQRF